MELHENYVYLDEIFGCRRSRDHHLSYASFICCIMFIHSDKLTYEELAIPGDWYDQCSLAFKINACAYHHPLGIVGLIIIPCNFDNQGFSFLDWVLGKVSVQ
jgi:hypothetical protein